MNSPPDITAPWSALSESIGADLEDQLGFAEDYCGTDGGLEGLGCSLRGADHSSTFAGDSQPALSQSLMGPPKPIWQSLQPENLGTKYTDNLLSDQYFGRQDSFPGDCYSLSTESDQLIGFSSSSGPPQSQYSGTFENISSSGDDPALGDGSCSLNSSTFDMRAPRRNLASSVKDQLDSRFLASGVKTPLSHSTLSLISQPDWASCTKVLAKACQVLECTCSLDPNPTKGQKLALASFLGVSFGFVERFYAEVNSLMLVPNKQSGSMLCSFETNSASNVGKRQIKPKYSDSAYGTNSSNESTSNRNREALTVYSGAVQMSEERPTPALESTYNSNPSKESTGAHKRARLSGHSHVSRPLEEGAVLVRTDSRGRKGPKRFCCTWPPCPQKYHKKHDWVRHEEEVHCLQFIWTCPIQVGDSSSDDAENTACSQKFKRDDKFKTHLLTRHSITPSIIIADQRQAEFPPNPFRKDCGFCGEHLPTWNYRADHISDHLMKGMDMSQWKEFSPRDSNGGNIGPDGNNYEDDPDANDGNGNDGGASSQGPRRSTKGSNRNSGSGYGMGNQGRNGTSGQSNNRHVNCHVYTEFLKLEFIGVFEGYEGGLNGRCPDDRKTLMPISTRSLQKQDAVAYFYFTNTGACNLIDGIIRQLLYQLYSHSKHRLTYESIARFRSGDHVLDKHRIMHILDTAIETGRSLSLRSPRLFRIPHSLASSAYPVTWQQSWIRNANFEQILAMKLSELDQQNHLRDESVCETHTAFERFQQEDDFMNGSSAFPNSMESEFLKKYFAQRPRAQLGTKVKTTDELIDPSISEIITEELANTIGSATSQASVRELLELVEQQKLIHQLLMSRLKDITAQLRLQSEIPPQVWLQQPAVFRDALDRVTPIHLDFINSAESFLAILKIRFKDIAEEKIDRNEFLLSDAKQNRTLDIQKQPWKAIIKPGQHISMSIVFKSGFRRQYCPVCSYSNRASEGHDVVCITCGVTYCHVEEPNPLYVVYNAHMNNITIANFRRVHIIGPELSPSSDHTPEKMWENMEVYQNDTHVESPSTASIGIGSAFMDSDSLDDRAYLGTSSNLDKAESFFPRPQKNPFLIRKRLEMLLEQKAQLDQEIASIQNAAMQCPFSQPQTRPPLKRKISELYSQQNSVRMSGSISQCLASSITRLGPKSSSSSNIPFSNHSDHMPPLLHENRRKKVPELYISECDDPIANYSPILHPLEQVTELDFLGDPPADNSTRIVVKKLYQRPKLERLFCERCTNYPQGFRGAYELMRHMDRQHNKSIKKWICVEPVDGIKKEFQPVNSLAKCKACSNLKKEYQAYYNAAAHLRRAHFQPKPRDRFARKQEKLAKRGGKGSGNWPPMSEMKRWMKEVTIPVDENQPRADNEDKEDCRVTDFDENEPVWNNMPNKVIAPPNYSNDFTYEKPYDIPKIVLSRFDNGSAMRDSLAHHMIETYDLGSNYSTQPLTDPLSDLSSPREINYTIPPFTDPLSNLTLPYQNLDSTQYVLF